MLDAALRGDIRLVSSFALLEELEEVLMEHFGFAARIASAVRAEVEAIADVVDPVDVPKACRDPDDDQVLAAAAVGRAEAIVSGVKDLLVLEDYVGIPILTPAQFDRRRTERH